MSLPGAGHREQERGAKGVPLGQLSGLGEQGIGPDRVGLGDGVIGREQATGEGVVDLGEPVLAVGAEQRLGLEPSQSLGLSSAFPRRARRRPARTGSSPPRGLWARVAGPRRGSSGRRPASRPAARRSLGGIGNTTCPKAFSPRRSGGRGRSRPRQYFPSCIAATTGPGKSGVIGATARAAVVFVEGSSAPKIAITPRTRKAAHRPWNWSPWRDIKGAPERVGEGVRRRTGPAGSYL